MALAFYTAINPTDIPITGIAGIGDNKLLTLPNGVTLSIPPNVSQDTIGIFLGYHQ